MWERAQGHVNGLSPRGRGNPEYGANPLVGHGSIPAWAGEPCISFRFILLPPVYPRVGGGTCSTGVRSHATRGLSPRGRGNPHQNLGMSPPEGSIPAWAGEPWPPCLMAYIPSVYPRVGGGTVLSGLSSQEHQGLSPRGRGNPVRHPYRPRPAGSIPAWAGEPIMSDRRYQPSTVYPRVGGGTLILYLSVH